MAEQESQTTASNPQVGLTEFKRPIYFAVGDKPGQFVGVYGNVLELDACFMVASEAKGEISCHDPESLEVISDSDDFRVKLLEIQVTCRKLNHPE